MPNDPSPTPSPWPDLRCAALPAGAGAGGGHVFASIVSLEPPHDSEHDEDDPITLSTSLVAGVLPTAPVGYQFQVTLNSNGAEGTAAHGGLIFSLAPGSVTTFYLEVEHSDPDDGHYELEVLVHAAEIGSGNFQPIASNPAIGDPPRD